MAKSPARLVNIKLSPNLEKTSLRFHLAFQPSPPHPRNIEFELEASDAMHLLSALQSIQRGTGWKVPQFLGRNRGRPKLRIVKKDD
jgi:hypothetical protein